VIGVQEYIKTRSFNNKTIYGATVKRIIFAALFSVLVIAGVALSEYFPDVIVTSPDGIWTDTRAYATIDAAITAVGANVRDIYVVRQEATTTLTIPNNANLSFFNTGSIANSGQLTIETTSIRAPPNRQIFTGTGNIDFATGSILNSGWFSNIETAFALTTNDTITLIISQPATITASYSPGDNVVLKWESPGNILTINAAVVCGNLKLIEAGNYQLFTGAGDFDFLDGTRLKLCWFQRLRSVTTYVESEEVTLVVSGTNIVDLTETVDANIILDMDSESGIFSDNGGAIDLTINGAFIAKPRQVFIWTGSGDVIMTSAQIKHGYGEWWGIDGTADEVQINQALTACRRVQLLEYDYAAAAAITAVSDGMLRGVEDQTTITQGADGNAITISNVSNFILESIKFDGQSAARANSVPVRIGGTTSATTSNIHLNYLTVHDGDVYAISILAGSAETITDVFANGTRIDTACSAMAISISGYSTGGGSASTTRNVRFTDTVISSVTGGGCSINGRSITYSGNVVDSIHFDGYRCNTPGGIGWGANEGATNCTLKKFYINDPTGNGVSIESCWGYTVSDGEILNAGSRGIRLFNTGTGGTEQDAAKNGLIQRVLVKDSGDDGIEIRGGVAVTNPAKHITVRDCQVTGSTEHGIEIEKAEKCRIVNNDIWDNGGAGNAKRGISCSAGATLPQDANLIIGNNVYGSDQDYGIYVLDDDGYWTIRDNFCFDNAVQDFITNDAGAHAIISERITAYFGTIAAGTDDERPIFTAPGINGTYITKCYLVNASNITQNDTDYETFTLNDKAADGNSTNVIASGTTKSTGGVAVLDFDEMEWDAVLNATHRVLANGDVVTFAKTHSGTGQGTDEMIVIVDYVNY